jgi:hypothetical protein
MTPRRSNHQGSIYRRASDGLWMGVAHFGYDASGKPIGTRTNCATQRQVSCLLKA